MTGDGLWKSTHQDGDDLGMVYEIGLTTYFELWWCSIFMGIYIYIEALPVKNTVDLRVVGDQISWYGIHETIPWNMGSGFGMIWWANRGQSLDGRSSIAKVGANNSNFTRLYGNEISIVILRIYKPRNTTGPHLVYTVIFFNGDLLT
jgi:hypothetical protein